MICALNVGSDNVWQMMKRSPETFLLPQDRDLNYLLIIPYVTSR